MALSGCLWVGSSGKKGLRRVYPGVSGWQRTTVAAVPPSPILTSEDGGGCGCAAEFLGARNPHGNGVGEWQWAGMAPKCPACRGIFGAAAVRRPHGGVVCSGGVRWVCCGFEEATGGEGRVSAAVVGVPRRGCGNGGVGERQLA